jgi:hypothetical protein
MADLFKYLLTYKEKEAPVTQNIEVVILYQEQLIAST